MIRPLPTSEIYDGIESLNLPDDVQGWHSSHPIFAKLIEETKPLTIVECGTWKGASLIHMAKLAPRAQLYAVDTWLGGIDHEMRQDEPTSILERDRGYPRLYFQFLANVARAGIHDRVCPIPQTSVNGAKLLRAYDVKTTLCYIDASHEYEDVFADLKAYWPLVESGGVIFGDDWAFPGVVAAVIRFCAEYGLAHRLKVEEQNFWIIRKPKAADPVTY